MISLSYYTLLDPSYRHVLLKLKDAVAEDGNSYDLNSPSGKLVSEFVSNYLTPREILIEIWTNYGQDRLKLYPLLLYHFCYIYDFESESKDYIVPKRKFMNKNRNSRDYGSLKDEHVEIEDLCYPHNLLEYYLYTYEANSDSHLPNKIIKRNFAMRKLYEKIKTVKHDDKQWINAMAEADDIEFVKHNVEYKLGQDLTNKRLWILYIRYLKEYDIRGLLQTYSKYCRFFTDDHAMRQEYCNAAKIFGKVTVPWKRTFNFEIYDENLLNVTYPKRYSTCIRAIKPKKYFDFETVMSQKFPFRLTLINYIVKNATAEILQKLNFSCKYFYYQYRIPVCYELNIASTGVTWSRSIKYLCRFQKESVFYSLIKSRTNGIKEIPTDKFFVSTKFAYHHREPISNLIPKIYRCHAKFIQIYSQRLTINELKFFIGHGNVVDLCFNRVAVIGGNGESLHLEDIIALTPNLQYLCIKPSCCSENTAQKLCQLTFQNKFKSFILGKRTNSLLEPHAFGEFVTKNFSSNSEIIVNFDMVKRRTAKIFDRTVQNAIADFWDEEDEQPNFSIFDW